MVVLSIFIREGAQMTERAYGSMTLHNKGSLINLIMFTYVYKQYILVIQESEYNLTVIGYNESP